MRDQGPIFVRALALTAALLCGTTAWVPAAGAAKGTASSTGVVKLSPTAADVGASKTLTITYTASKSVPFTGQVRIDVPAGFSVPQTSNPAAASFLRITSNSCANAVLNSVSPIGSASRVLLDINCAPGKSLKLTWKAARVPTAAMISTFHPAVAPAGSGFTGLVPEPTFVTKPGTATHLVLDAPTYANAGTPVTLTVAGQDAFGNVDPKFKRVVHFSNSAGGATLPADYSMTVGKRSDNGTHTFVDGAVLNTVGPNVLTMRTVEKHPMSASATVSVDTFSPGTKTWASPGRSGLWDDATRWTPPGVPGPSDSVRLLDGAYTVTVSSAQASDVTIGAGVTVDVQSGGYLVANSIVDHGTLHLGTATGATILFGGSSVEVAADGTLEITGTGVASMRGDVVNVGSVIVHATLQCCGGSADPSTWTNLAGSSTVIHGALQVRPDSQTMVHQAGAVLTVGAAGTLRVGDASGGNTSAFVDDGGTIFGRIQLVGAQLQLNAGSTGTFDVHGLTTLGGTIRRGQLVNVQPAGGTNAWLVASGLTNHGDLVATAPNVGDVASVIGDLTNAADGVFRVIGAGDAVLGGDFDNAGAAEVADATTLQYHCSPTSCAPPTWTNQPGSTMTIHGLVRMSDGSTMVHENGARLDIDAAAGRGLLLDANPVPTFTDNGGTINGGIDVLTGAVNLNAGNTGTFIARGFAIFTGEIRAGQTVDVIGGDDGFGGAHNATLVAGSGALTNHGTIRLRSNGGGFVAGVSGDLTSDGTVRAEAAGGGTRAIQRSFTNAGVLAVEAGVTLIVGTDYVQQASATFDASVQNASSVGQLRVTGSASVSGTLHVTLTNGYVPHVGDHLDIATGARGGTQFTSANTAGYGVDYSVANKVSLTR